MNDYEKMNNILLENTQGIISSPNKVIKNSFGEVIYTPPQGIDLIRKLLHNLDDYFNHFNEEQEIDPLLKLPILHYQFEAIHPFGDGNGRTGRILMVLFLVLHEKLDLPILFLSAYISRHKKEYYEFFHRLDEKKDQESLKEYILWLITGIGIQAMFTQISISSIQILMLQTSKSIK